jgi:glycosyltransferase involved in cell wall biosynthesis
MRPAASDHADALDAPGGAEWQRLKEPRPRLLFLSQTLPYPPDGGVNIRTYNVLRLLSSAFDVTALCFFRRRERPTTAEVRQSLTALSTMCRVEAFAIPQEHSRARMVWDHARSVLTRRAYTIPTYDSPAYTRSLRDALESASFEIVHVDSLDLAGHLRHLPDIPIVCVHHNVESQLLRRRAARERASLMRGYIGLQADFTEQLERIWCPRFALNVTVSSEDAAELGRVAPDAKTVVIPNGVDTESFRPTEQRGDGIVCVGGINGFANRDGLEYLCDSILPIVRQRVPAIRTRWVGRADPAAQESFKERHGVELTGYVEDVRPHVRAARCFVVPLRVGGGTRVKILDAWAMGMPVVSTAIGCEGLAAVHGENILIADTPSDFADAVIAVLSDDSLAERLGKNARRSAEDQYSWRVVGASMIESYRGLAERRLVS